MLVCVFSDVKIEVILCNFCPGTDISSEVQPIGVRLCTMVDMGLTRFLPFGGTPKLP